MHGKVSLSRLLANRHRTALGLNKSLLFPCKGQFLPMIKASQWIQELLSSWSGGAREISRTCTSFTLAADTSLCVWCQRDLTSLKKKNTRMHRSDCCKSLLLQQGKERVGSSLLSPRCLCCALALGSFPRAQPLLLGLCVLCWVGMQSPRQDQALHKHMTRRSLPLPLRGTTPNRQA